MSAASRRRKRQRKAERDKHFRDAQDMFAFMEAMKRLGVTPMQVSDAELEEIRAYDKLISKINAKEGNI